MINFFFISLYSEIFSGGLQKFLLGGVEQLGRFYEKINGLIYLVNKLTN
jgi:hypothetical protein